jgi:asparagine synthase (glutamine-hydrolysing)
MCGIFGAIGRKLDQSAVDDVLAALGHRGPDGCGIFEDEQAEVTLAHTRLAVIDLETGAQPLETDDGTLVLCANGEIYDFERIRISLEAKGHRFHTKSDSEVIIYLYRELGLQCFEHLRGEFAFLLYDKAQRRLIAARDRFGIKPLYFAKLDGGFVFASEIKAIFASGHVEPKLDVVALDPFGNGSYSRLPFEGIEHVPPACVVAIDVDTLASSVTRYWSAEIPDDSSEPPPDAADERQRSASLILDELEQAVRLRLRADVPVGLYLSGGIDSSFIGALMERNLSGPLHSFSIAFPGSEKDEQAFARRAADFLGTEHHELAVGRAELWQHLEDSLWFSELPFVTLAPVGKFLLSEEARKHVTVVLTGEGADEVFLGYRGYFHRALGKGVRNAARENASAVRRSRFNLEGRGGRTFAKLSLLLVDKKHRARLKAARATTVTESDPDRPLINRLQEARIADMPYDILCFLGDREEMAHSLEARLPFLDHHLYDAAKHIPAKVKFRDGVEKTVLRDAASGIVPDDLRVRRKQGFMRTSGDVDFFGRDRQFTAGLRGRYLSREAIERAGLFSYRGYRALRLLASSRLPMFRRSRRMANKAIMFIMQMHMLHRMFVAEPRWRQAPAKAADRVDSPAEELAA